MVQGEYDVDGGEEGSLVELPALRQLVAMGYEYKSRSELNKEERIDYRDVLLHTRLHTALEKLNPGISDEEIDEAVKQLKENKSSDTPVTTNRKIHAKLVGWSQTNDTIPVTIKRKTNGVSTSIRINFFDFDNPENNNFLVTNQFRVDGYKRSIFPDIVIFVNGIPLVVIECKAPSIPDPIEKAFMDNLRKYQNTTQGHKQLFYYNHLLVATCGDIARVGTIETEINHYTPWSDGYPYTKNELKELNGQAREQEILIGSLLSKSILLHTLQNFVMYDTKNNKEIKIVARYPQLRAVTKAIERIHTHDKSKGGVVWHTQGSGKSLSMVWLAILAKRKFANIPIVVITDRTQLDRQISNTFKNYGFANPHRASSKKDLAELLKNPRGKTIMTVIDKFDGVGICIKERVLCLVDEAHRSQFRIKAANMRASLPNGIFYAFTGTPIDRQDKSTFDIFGPLIDKYGFRESQADKTTLPITYDGRLPKVYVDGYDNIDELFEHVFADCDEDTRKIVKQKYVTKNSLAEAPHRIEMIANDIVKHYTEYIKPNGCKAMLVTSSRAAAVLYKKALDSIANSPKSTIIMSDYEGYDQDGQSWNVHHLTKEECGITAEKFKRSDDPTKILIVVDMLLVGYDAPICQALYLDKGLRDHNLLQAIARVNRPYTTEKTHGIIVDYYGVTQELHKAFLAFDSMDIVDALVPLGKIYADLDVACKIAMKHLEKINYKNHNTVIIAFENSEKRAKFESDFRKFLNILNAALPDKNAISYIDNWRLMARCLRWLATYYGRHDVYMKLYGEKIKDIINKHIVAGDIEILINQQQIINKHFLDIINNKIESKAARAALLKNRIRIVIKEIWATDPTYAESLKERLEKIIRDENMRRIENLELYLDELVDIYNDAVNREKVIKDVFGSYEATPFEFAIYNVMMPIVGKEASVNLSIKLFEQLIPYTQIIDWPDKPTIDKDIQKDIYEMLQKEKQVGTDIDSALEKIRDLVKNHYAQ